MRTNKPMCAMAIGLFSIYLALFNPAGLEASQYLGEVTWTAQKTMDSHGSTSGTFTIKAGLSHMGGSYYSIQGYGDLSSNPALIFSGGGMIVGDNLILTVNGSAENMAAQGCCYNNTFTFQFKVNKDSFNGTFFGLGKGFNTNNLTLGEEFAAGTLTLVGNPIPLNLSPSAYLPLIKK
jgi:hypothetical protein